LADYPFDRDRRSTGAEPSPEIVQKPSTDAVRWLSAISVFLLAYNEEGDIERVVEGFKAQLPKLANDYEIIVVDDGSSDHTGQIATPSQRPTPTCESSTTQSTGAMARRLFRV
jgi:cellulose synthase/poly-beta-1,6-N-acetylglucosamine synthase-like glycosyltransferase